MKTPSSGLRKGSWTVQEDTLLRQCIDKYGEGKWHQVPFKAGLNRCRKSCRLRWLNYLKPSIKRGKFAYDEVDLLLRLHKLLGNRWSLIAGRIPGRTANDIKNFWNTHLNKKEVMSSMTSKMGERNPTSTSDSAVTTVPNIDVIYPQFQSFSNNNGRSLVNSMPEVDLSGIIKIDDSITCNNNFCEDNTVTSNKDKEKYEIDGDIMWWESFVEETGEADTMGPATMAAEEASTSSMNSSSSSSMFDVETLWSMFNEELD